MMPPNVTGGTINCTMRDDMVLSYEDVCTVMCNTGYVLIGDAMRTCQNDTMLNGTEAMCNRGNG